MNKELKGYIPHIILLLSFLFESLEGQTRYFLGSSFGLSFILKSFVFIYFLAISFLHYKKLYSWLGGLFGLFIFSQFTYTQFEFDVLKNINMFFNYVYPFVVLMGLRISVNSSNAHQLKKILQIGLLLVLISIVVGAIFNLPSLATYSYRFGFKGLITRPSTASYFIMLSWVVFLQSEWSLKFQTAVYFLLFIVSFLVGTKASLLFLAFVVLHLAVQRKIKFSFSKLLIGGATFLGVVVAIFYRYQDRIIHTKGQHLKLYTNEGWISALSSFRSRKLNEISSYYLENWNIVNYFVGGRHVFIENFEFDVLDVLLHFGLLGTLIYIFVAKKLVMPLLPKNQVILFIGLLVVALLAGQLFYNTYIALLLSYYLIVQNTNTLGNETTI